MIPRRRTLRAGTLLCAVPVLVALQGCAVSFNDDKGGARSAPFVRTIGGLSPLAPVVACSDSKKDCPVNVLVKAAAPQIDPATGNLECGVRLDDVVVVRPGATAVTWTLQLPKDSQGIYSFRALKSVPGIYFYDDTVRAALPVTQSGPTSIVLNLPANPMKGAFGYAVYVQWQPSQGAAAQPCNVLDPIIVSVE